MLNLIAKIGNEIAKWFLIGLFFLVIVSNKSKQKFNFCSKPGYHQWQAWYLPNSPGGCHPCSLSMSKTQELWHLVPLWNPRTVCTEFWSYQCKPAAESMCPTINV